MTGEQLQQRRREAKVKAEELSEELDISPFTLSNWERGKIQIPKIAVIAIEVVLSRREAEQAALDRQAERQEHISSLAAKSRE